MEEKPPLERTLRVWWEFIWRSLYLLGHLQIRWVYCSRIDTWDSRLDRRRNE
jgi:hypothetical protein